MQASAPVYSITDEHRVRAESAAWSRFASADDSGEFFAGWLALLATRVGRTRAALLLVSEADPGPYTVVAAWPDPQRDLQYLGPVAQRALTQREGVVTSADGGDAVPEAAAHVAYPVELDGRVVGAVVLDIAGGAAQELQAALRQIHWASAWLLDHFRQRAMARTQAELARVALLNELMATALAQPQLKASALAVANELAARLSCDRVSLGFESNDRVVPLALSHTASFDRNSDLARGLGDAMEEVLDLGAPVALPRAAGDETAAMAHEQALRLLDSRALLSVPLMHEGRALGAITLERRRDEPFSPEDTRIAAAAGTLLGPVWALQQREERSTLTRWREALLDARQALFGPRHPGLKLAGALALLAFLVLTFWQTDYRVSARTVVEGATQIARVAPFDGYVAQGLVRAGDTVKQGQVMARLDDRDLKLERARWAAESDQLQRKFQVAMAQADRGSMGVLAAQVQQAQAQLALAEEKLVRATVTAPFDGVVVSGDLSQSIGTPVEQGRTLFEVAPLEGFRVVLQVDDRDIARLALGQRGELVLSSLPDRALPFAVSSVTSVATQQDGRNVFRVEAQVEGSPARLRPGMEGVGKVLVGERSLLWIATHGFVDWLRLTLWAWTP